MIVPNYPTNGPISRTSFSASYVYQYATSITAAKWFAQKVMGGTKAERDSYLNVLRSGGSDYG